MSEKKAKFTAIDAIIILVILAVIVVGAIKILPSFTSGSEKEKDHHRDRRKRCGQDGFPSGGKLFGRRNVKEQLQRRNRSFRRRKKPVRKRTGKPSGCGSKYRGLSSD